MLYEALLTTDLPRTVGPPLPTAFWDGVPRLLFTGAWYRRAATCTLSAAAVLAGTYGALREIAIAPGFEILDDAGELLDLSAVPVRWGDTPPPWAEILPPRWTSEPAAFRLVAVWEDGDFATAVVLRHTPRHDPEQASLAGAVRCAWSPAELGPSFEARIADSGAAARVAGLLRTHGDRVVDALSDALGRAFHGEARFSHRSRTVVLADDAGCDELLHGLPERAVEAMPRIRRCLSGAWPALAADGVEGHWRDGRFVPGAEVDHAV